VGTAFLVFAALSAWRGHYWPPRVLATLGAGLLVAGAVIPGRLGPVYRVWMRLAHAISRVTTPIALGIVYFVLLTPTGLLMRLIGRNPLRHAERQGGFWVPAPSGGRTDLDMQF
jgi:hypothetical protein